MYSPMDRHAHAQDVLFLQQEIRRLRKENFYLIQDNEMYKEENYELRNNNMVLAALVRTTLGMDYHSKYEGE